MQPPPQKQKGGGGMSGMADGDDWEEEEETGRRENSGRRVVYHEDEQTEEPPMLSAAEEPRYPCPLCGRKFMAENRLAKHTQACAKAQKSRKVFDATKARVKGTELEQYVMRSRVEKEKEKGGKGAKRQTYHQTDDLPLPAQHSKPSWRIKHENFIQMVRAARQPLPPRHQQPTTTRHSSTTSSPTRPQQPTYQPDPSLIPCDACNRRFNPDTAERHIPICRAAKQRAQFKAGGGGSPASGGGSSGGGGGLSPSKDDLLKKRTAYKPPPPKTKSPIKMAQARR
ncbi:Zinc finger C2HC domain-containing protein 1C [Rhizophlyctis rosea]|nr:Zinc finger C2HC domain-containing protein 1C [Rhizophlyctis rosea]